MSKLLNTLWLLIVTTTFFIVAMFLLPRNYVPLENPSAVQSLVNISSGENSRSSVRQFLAHSERIWRRGLAKRHAVVDAVGLDLLNPWNYPALQIWWDFFYPTFNCPHHMERLGSVGDGGKWVCGFSFFETPTSLPPCVVYSFGISGEYTFELEILRRSKCEIWAYDYSVDGMQTRPSVEGRVHFKKYAITNETKGRGHTLGDLMRENGHQWIDILKIDVEGAEFKSLSQIMDEFDTVLPFGQLQVEIHLDRQTDFPTFYRWWENLEAHGLRAIFMEPNMYGLALTKRPYLMEYVFLNVKANHTLTNNN